VVGVGFMGAPVLQYLVAAGVGQVTVMDPDRVERSNLQRQVLFADADVGRSKSQVAAESLRAQNPQVKIIDRAERFGVEHSVSGFDLVVDCTDNFAARYAINDACLAAGIPWIFASIHRFQGQCAVFDGADGPCYRCLFPTPPPAILAPNCAEAGVLGALPGFMGALQASEALQRLLGLETGLKGHVLTADLRQLDIRRFALSKNPDCLSCVHKTPMVPPTETCPSDWQVQPQTLAGWSLLDVRSHAEHAHHNLGGQNLPLDVLPTRLSDVPTDGKLLVYCQSGQRSAQAVSLLRAQGYTSAFSLRGGLSAWDPPAELEQ